MYTTKLYSVIVMANELSFVIQTFNNNTENALNSDPKAMELENNLPLNFRIHFHIKLHTEIQIAPLQAMTTVIS